MMRRKSTRTAAKSSPEKAKKPESPVRKSRRQSKRRKKVTTSESSDESPDELLSQVACDSKSATKTEEPVWKVTSSASPSGEVQKLKISLTRPANAEPTVTKRETRRSRSSAVVSDTDSDHFSGRAKGSNEESTDREDATNKDVDIKGKGKSKDKHKHQKSSQFSEEGIEKTCEISANIQVTTESPSIIDRVDDENLNTEMKKDISNANDDMSEKTSQEVKSEENQEEPEAVKDIANEAEDQIAQENKTEAENEQSNETDCAKVINPEEASETPHKETDEMHEEQKANLVETPCLGNEDVEKCESSSTVEEVSTTVESVVQSEPEQSQEIPNEVEKEEALPVVSAEDTAVIRDAEETNDEINSGHEEENTVEIKSQREEESTAEIKSGHEMDEPTPKGQEDTGNSY